MKTYYPERVAILKTSYMLRRNNYWISSSSDRMSVVELKELSSCFVEDLCVTGRPRLR